MSTTPDQMAAARIQWIERVREAFINCNDCDMDNHYDIPTEEWEKLKAAIMSPIRYYPTGE